MIEKVIRTNFSITRQERGTTGAKYPRMDQVKFVEDSIYADHITSNFLKAAFRKFGKLKRSFIENVKFNCTYKTNKTIKIL